MPYGSTLHIPPTNLLLLAAKQEPYKKAHLLTENIEEFSGKSSGEWASRQKKYKTERVTGPGRRTGQEIVKWNQMTALRLQTGGRHLVAFLSCAPSAWSLLFRVCHSVRVTPLLVAIGYSQLFPKLIKSRIIGLTGWMDG